MQYGNNMAHQSRSFNLRYALNLHRDHSYCDFPIYKYMYTNIYIHICISCPPPAKMCRMHTEVTHTATFPDVWDSIYKYTCIHICIDTNAYPTLPPPSMTGIHNATRTWHTNHNHQNFRSVLNVRGDDSYCEYSIDMYMHILPFSRHP